MISYELSIHQPCSSFSEFDTFSSDVITLSDLGEFNRVNNLCQNESNMAGVLKASIMPIRTKLKYLKQDLVHPISTLAFKTRFVASVSFVVISFFWDVVTLPLRLLSLIPRLVYNANKSSKEHPLTTYLRSKGIIAKKEVSVRVYKKTQLDNRTVEEGNKYMLYLSKKEVPFFKESRQFSLTYPSH